MGSCLLGRGVTQLRDRLVERRQLSEAQLVVVKVVPVLARQQAALQRDLAIGCERDPIDHDVHSLIARA